MSEFYKWVKAHRTGLIQAGLLFGGAWLLLKIVCVLIPLPQTSLFRPTATLVFDQKAKLLRAFQSTDDKWRVRTPLTQISPALQKMLLGYEDQWFYWHQGVNWVAFGRAAMQNFQAKEVVSGGSTLTMQIARMIEPKERSYQSKLLEVARASQLEMVFGKKKLLEIYFNIAPYGGNIEGVAAAAWLYFGKEPSQLSDGEAALLAAIPNSPERFRPDRYPKAARKARDLVLNRAWKSGIIKKNEYLSALREEIPSERLKLPFSAPHLALELKRRYPGEARLYSTLDQATQLFCEEQLGAHLRKLRQEGITNGAIIVIDNQRQELVAAVGSGEFFNKNLGGQVNGYLAPRSPGSALKPFVYALGIERGLITPQSYLEDVPVDFGGGYAPENFDRSFSGIVPAREALAKSLNVPAIMLLSKLGEQGLYQLLRTANFSTIKAVDHYGLSIVLGGCEVTLLELTSLYSTLAKNGAYAPPKLLRDEVGQVPLQLFSAGTAYIITDILEEVRRPDLPACWEFTSLPRVAWKTGTSYGHRDAWSVGYNPRYTIGVWCGNFNGDGKPGLVGAEVAAPLLFDLFNYMNRQGSAGWFVKPRGVGVRKVCALSGQLPGVSCTSQVSEYYLTDRSSDEECKLHQVVKLDAKTGYRLPPHYLSGTRQTVDHYYLHWPARVASWLSSNGQPVNELPALIPDWQGVIAGQPPLIHSPASDYQYQLREGITSDYQKISLEAAASNEVRKLYWFVDGKLFGTAKPGERLFYPPLPGVHQVVCQDDQGRSSAVKLVVNE